MTLALLITAVGGAWAAETTVTWVTTDFYGTGSAAFTKKDVTVTPGNNDARHSNFFYANGANTFTTTLGNFTKIEIVFMPSSSPITISGWDYELIEAVQPEPEYEPNYWQYTSKLTWTGDAESVSIQGLVASILSITFTIAKPDVEVTTNAASKQDLFTEAWFNMPTFDATVNYDIVRDMQDETNPVAFSGLPSSGNIVVKKGDDGKYQPIEALTIQLIDPMAAAEAQNIIAADGITIKVLVGAEDEKGAIDYDQDNPITLEAFLADMKPGYYWIKAVPTDETTSPYIGTVYSSEFTVVEKYDLTVKPANDFSKGKIESVTVGGGSVTIDANTGEAAKTGIDPETEVKVKAKRGYVIEKVEVKKAGPALKTLTVTGVTTKSINYAEGDTWQQAIERPENAGSGWRVQGDYIFNGGLTLMIGSGYVRPGHTIDATKNYSLEAD